MRDGLRIGLIVGLSAFAVLLAAAPARGGVIEVNVQGLPSTVRPYLQIYTMGARRIPYAGESRHRFRVRLPAGRYGLVRLPLRIAKNGGGFRRGDVAVPASVLVDGKRASGGIVVRGATPVQLVVRYRRLRTGPALTGVTTVSVGTAACAVVASAAQCWGSGSNAGELRFGSNPETIIPRAVRDVAVGRFHACALLDGGEVRCWGRGEEGALGDGTTRSSTTPVTAIASGATALSTSCAVIAPEGRVDCWGPDAGEGDWGPGATLQSAEDSYSARPATVIARGATAVAGRCALMDTSAVVCWGEWEEANGYLIYRQPTTVVESGAVALADTGNCATLEDRTVVCWGQLRSPATSTGTFYRTAQPWPQGTGASVFPTVFERSCGLFGEAVRCTGLGLLGDGVYHRRPTREPVTVFASGATDVAVGENRSCAVVRGTAMCWGKGPLGDGSGLDAGFPVSVRQRR